MEKDSSGSDLQTKNYAIACDIITCDITTCDITTCDITTCDII